MKKRALPPSSFLFLKKGGLKMDDVFIAHQRKSDNNIQTVGKHLIEVSAICGRLSHKIGLPEAGQLLGLLHDLGKYSHAFQVYIKSSIGMYNPDIDDEYVDVKGLKGKIDHSTAGAQWVWQKSTGYGIRGRLIGQILAVCLASHHGGLIDCLRADGENGFQKRICKEDEKTHLMECLNTCEKEITTQLSNFASNRFLKDVWEKIVAVVEPRKSEADRLKHFRLGFFTRFLFSCLIDADRINSADFEHPANAKHRFSGPPNWRTAIARLESHLAGLYERNKVDTIRNRISDQCRKRAADPQGVYTLTVPTGGGKTFASIRYALHHAEVHALDHIYYVIPYTSIIEQNARVVGEVLEKADDEYPWVLEHHSNLEPESLTWQAKLSAENWDAPIIFTTMVKFLEVLFDGGTRGARRLHNLARSVIIFDEIQNLPVKCVHLFCNGLKFLVQHAGSTAILCTATQPLLNGVNPQYGALEMSGKDELVHDAAGLFQKLKRVEITNLIRPKGWTKEEIADLALKQIHESDNCLIVVNTKAWARILFDCCRSHLEKEAVVHLSTSLCPAHRSRVFAKVNQRLNNNLPLLCITTQLIEAGVDFDFNAVIRFLAGLDSIAQAAGRCNRNGRHKISPVFVVNPKDEAITRLDDIRIGRNKAMRVLGEPGHGDFLSPQVMARYFSYYFYDRADEMQYPLTENEAGRCDTLLNLLCDNPLNVGRSQDPRQAMFLLQQSFKTAGRAFAAIDAPTKTVIVPYGEGRDIIARLCADVAPAAAFNLLKKAQKYSVNLFPNVWDKLVTQQAVHVVRDGEGICYLDARYYSEHFGVSTEAVAEVDTLII
jgi:CRISPR-associated endonuclease/helicase Cas3